MAEHIKISVQSSKMLGKILLKQSGDWLQVALIKKREHSLRTILLSYVVSLTVLSAISSLFILYFLPLGIVLVL